MLVKKVGTHTYMNRVESCRTFSSLFEFTTEEPPTGSRGRGGRISRFNLGGGEVADMEERLNPKLEEDKATDLLETAFTFVKQLQDANITHNLLFMPSSASTDGVKSPKTSCKIYLAARKFYSQESANVFAAAAMETITGYWICPSKEIYESKGIADSRELLEKLAIDDETLREAWPAVAKSLM